MPRSRSERRHHHNRMLEKVKHYSYYWHNWMDEQDMWLHQKKTAENRHPCSCHMCCNPRHSGFHKGKEKMTMQERKFIEYDDE